MPGLTDAQRNTLITILEIQENVSDMKAKINSQAVAIATRDEIIKIQKEELAEHDRYITMLKEDLNIALEAVMNLTTTNEFVEEGEPTGLPPGRKFA